MERDRRRPGWVYQHGTEPDPRFSLANERTYLAWIRTALALLAGAAAIHAFDLDVSPTTARWSASLLALAGIACSVQAVVGWAGVERAIRQGAPLPGNGFGAVLAAAVGVAGVVILVVGAR